jgi:hypothetical protein
MPKIKILGRKPMYPDDCGHCRKGQFYALVEIEGRYYDLSFVEESKEPVYCLRDGEGGDYSTSLVRYFELADPALGREMWEHYGRFKGQPNAEK